jgi:hypothetical protein
VIYANPVPRLPEIRDRIDVSNAALGSAIAAMPVGALIGVVAAGAVVLLFGRVLVATAAGAKGDSPAGLAPSGRVSSQPRHQLTATR